MALTLTDVFAAVHQHAPALARASGVRERDVHAVVEGAELAAKVFEALAPQAVVAPDADPVVVAALATAPAPQPRRRRKPRAKRSPGTKAAKRGAARDGPKAPEVRAVKPIARGEPDPQAWRQVAERIMRNRYAPEP